MNSKNAGIYSITSKATGSRYLGSSILICNRWRDHLKTLRTNKHVNAHLQNHYNKYQETDLIFSVVEIVERGNLSLHDFKKLLLEREQVYLDNWEHCEFNILKVAGSRLGHKQPNAKYYSYSKTLNKWIVSFSINESQKCFGYFETEKEAKTLTDFLKQLSDEERLDYYKNVYKPNLKFGRGKGIRDKNAKNYNYNKKLNKWKVEFRIDGKKKFFGYFLTEEEAQQRAAEIRLQLSQNQEV